MKKSIIPNLAKTIQNEDPKSDAFFVTHGEDNQISTAIIGDSDMIAQSIYAIINDTQDPEMSLQVYNMIKNIAYNILKNDTAFSQDMEDMFNIALYQESGKSPNTFSMYPNMGEA